MRSFNPYFVDFFFLIRNKILINKDLKVHVKDEKSFPYIQTLRGVPLKVVVVEARKEELLIILLKPEDIRET